MTPPSKETPCQEKAPHVFGNMHLLYFSHHLFMLSVLHAFDQDEVWICKNDVLNAWMCVCSRQQQDLSYWLINYYSINLYGPTHSAYAVYCLLSNYMIYHLSIASIPLTCHWPLTRPERKWIREREKELGSHIKVQRSIWSNTPCCMLWYLEYQHLWFSIESMRHRLLVNRWTALTLLLPLSDTHT